MLSLTDFTKLFLTVIVFLIYWIFICLYFMTLFLPNILCLHLTYACVLTLFLPDVLDYSALHLLKC